MHTPSFEAWRDSNIITPEWEYRVSKTFKYVLYEQSYNITCCKNKGQSSWMFSVSRNSVNFSVD